MSDFTVENEPQKNCNFKAKTICDLDDLITMIVVDSCLGFQTHKMNTKFRPNKSYEKEWKLIIQNFESKELTYEQCYEKIISNTWVKAMLTQINNPTLNITLNKNIPENDLLVFKYHLDRYLHLFDYSSGITIQECRR